MDEEKKKPEAKRDTDARERELKEAEGKRNLAKGKRDELRRQLQRNIATAANASSKIAKVTDAGGLAITPDPRIAAELRKMQQEFLNRCGTSH